jgi:hypothetical protein
MGRSFESIRMGVKDVFARWLKASRALKKEEVYAQKLAEMAKKHSSGVLCPGRSVRGCGVLSPVGIGEGDGQGRPRE